MFPFLKSKFFSFVSKAYNTLKVYLYKTYIFVKTNSLYILSSIFVISIGVGGILYYKYLQNLRKLAREYFKYIKEIDKRDPFMDPDFINFLKTFGVVSPLFQKSLEELMIIYGQSNSNALDILSFLIPLWANFDPFTKLALKIYLIRCIEGGLKFKGAFCKTFILYVRYMVMRKYGDHYGDQGDQMSLSFFGVSDSDITIDDFNEYIDTWESLYSINKIDFLSYYPIDHNGLPIFKFDFMNLPFSLNSNGLLSIDQVSVIINSPIYMSYFPNSHLKNLHPILQEVQSIVNNSNLLIDKNGILVINIEQKNLYYHFLNKNISYIIQIICDIFS